MGFTSRSPTRFSWWRPEKPPPPAKFGYHEGKVTILTYTQEKRTYFWNVPRAFSRTKAYPALLQCEPDHHQHRAHHRQLPTQVMAWLELCIGKMLLALLYMKRRDRFLSKGYEIWPGKKKKKGQYNDFNEWGRSQERLANYWMFIVPQMKW